MDENDTVESLNHKSDSTVDGPDDNFDRPNTPQNSPLRNESDNPRDVDSLIDPVTNGSPELGISETITDDPSLDNTADSTEDGENRNVDTVDDAEEMLVDETPSESTAVKPKPDKLCQLPLGSVKRIVKSDPDVPVVNAESLFLITKATVSQIQCYLVIYCSFCDSDFYL